VKAAQPESRPHEKEQEVNDNTTNRKKSITAVLGAVAATVAVEIHSTGSEGLCFYSAEPWFGWQAVKPLPVYKVPFYLQANQTHNLWFPGIQTGTTWKAKVECPVGGADFFNPTY
jgi:hypothetical protein